MRISRLAVTVIACIMLAGCAAKNVVFFEAPREIRADGTRIFIDAFGSAYPRDGMLLPDDADLPGGSLKDYLTRGAAPACLVALEGSQTRALCDAETDDAWRTAQQAIWQSAAAQIVAESGAAQGNADIVFLVHGFNNDFAASSRSFATARRWLTPLANPERRQYFVSVHWDGFTSPFPPRIWGRAQASGPLVGFGMRPMLNALADDPGLDEDTTLRFLTHSSGAFVLGAAFGDPAATLPELRSPDNPEYRFFAAHAGAEGGPYRVPQFENLRIGMLAAATSSDTFADAQNIGQGFLSRGAQLLLAVNPHDGTLAKRGLGADFPLSGATGLGANRLYFCRVLRTDAGLAARKVNVVAYDFDRTDTAMADRKSSHDFADYLEQAADHSTFLADFMSVQPVERAEEATRLCQGT
ncbi:MAG: hypothetical protein WBA68_06185 [Alteraurantiacibacter sp.]